MNKYALHGKLTAAPGKTDALAAILLRAADLVATASGCHLYVISKDPTDESAVWVTEIWDSKEDHDQSLQLPSVRELIGEAMPLLGGAPSKGQELEVLGGVGLS